MPDERVISIKEDSINWSFDVFTLSKITDATTCIYRLNEVGLEKYNEKLSGKIKKREFIKLV